MMPVSDVACSDIGVHDDDMWVLFTSEVTSIKFSGDLCLFFLPSPSPQCTLCIKKNNNTHLQKHLEKETRWLHIFKSLCMEGGSQPILFGAFVQGAI